MLDISRVQKIAPLVAALSISFILGGCGVKNVKISDESRASLGDGSDIVASYHGPVQPNILTPAGALGASERGSLLGAFMNDKDREMKGITSSDSFTKMDGPMKEVRNHLVKTLASRGMDKLTTTEHPSDRFKRGQANAAELSEEFGKRYVLAIEPSTWNIMYFATNWNRYWMQFYAEGVIIDSDSGQELWRSRCNGNVDDKEVAPTWEELNANDRQLLQEWIKKGAATCAQQLTDDLVGKI